jgi:hypothetical protein
MPLFPLLQQSEVQIQVEWSETLRVRKSSSDDSLRDCPCPTCTRTKPLIYPRASTSFADVAACGSCANRKFEASVSKQIISVLLNHSISLLDSDSYFKSYLNFFTIKNVSFQ